ncbi:hypothetical protein BDN71DRAFT_1473715 [Pleurotus eryngii]|uniref:Fungal-type protein kinase domain-containing protein n=1 Tax=Pleurotus eryngii TaxID=5323 RepID=A0A9P5ZQT1_PLEER|nr:hypothetical protein BDN71DRAFT_1473715 [Pleurotus eryngii]
MSSPLKLGAISIKNHTRRNVDNATRNDFSGNIVQDVPLEDFVSASFSISKDDILATKSRPCDTIDVDVSNYRRMVQQKAPEDKLYPFFQRIIVKLGQEVTEEDLAFVVRVLGTDALKNKYTSRKPDGSIWRDNVDLVWHLMKVAIEMKRWKKSSHCDLGTQAQTMPDIVYETETPNRGPETGPSALRIPTIPEIPAPPANTSTPPPNATTELPASPLTRSPNATTDLLPVLSAASSNEAPLNVLESRVTPPVPSGPSCRKRPRKSEAPRPNKRPRTSRLTIDQTQIANYALECMASTVHRRWTIGVMVDNFWVTLWYFDCMGAIVTQPFDFAEEPWKLALVALALGRCTPTQAGFEPLILQPSGDTATGLPSFDRPISTVVGAEIVLPRDIAKPSKQDPRFVITAPPLYVYRGVVGRGSIVYPATALSGLFKNHQLVAKWSWPLTVRKREHNLIDRLPKSVPLMQQHLPEVLEHREYSMEELGLARCKIGSGGETSRYEARKLTIVILPRYKHLWELDTVEKFKSVFIDIVECHYYAFHQGSVLHRDLNESNLMWTCGREKVPLGRLNDWDLSSLFEDGAPPPLVTQCRTGTTPFMAAELLEMCDNPPTHRYHHDLESFLYILIWAMVHYNMGNEELDIPPDPKKPRRLPTNNLLRPLEGDDYQANAAWKSNFKISKVSRRALFAAVQPAFAPLIDAWLKPLLKLFTRAALEDTEDPSDFDGDTLGGILTFDSFMKAIGAVPREIPAEYKKDG